MVKVRNNPATQKVTARRVRFARLIVEGMDQTDAWIVAYGHKEKGRSGNRRTATQQACRIAAEPAVRAEIARLRSLRDVKTVLSLNDRLSILARDAQLPGDGAPMVNARARSIEVYNKTAGDNAPERTEVTVVGDPDKPVITAQVNLTKAQKVAALRATRVQPAVAAAAGAAP